MNKDKEIFGIDISKDVFDVYNVSKGHHQFKNDKTDLNHSREPYQTNH
jgi:hypothetical protein